MEKERISLPGVSERDTYLVAAMLTPSIVEQGRLIFAEKNREPTEEDMAPIRQLFVDEWLRTVKSIRQQFL